MSYEKKIIKPGVTFHMIKTDKFKTNLFSVFLTTPLTKDNVTKNALIPAILRRGTQKFQTQEIISKKLEEMYGASFDCGVEKSGNNHVIKFYLEAINDEFLPNEEKISENCFNILLDIVLNPLTENNEFKEEYIKTEKENLKQIINSKIDNKAGYALERCIEEMYKDSQYGLYKYGYVSELEKITSKDLYNYYIWLIQNCKIDIFVSGKLDDNFEEKISKIDIINKLVNRKDSFIVNNEILENKDIVAKNVQESLKVTQGKLILGLNVPVKEKNMKFAASIYNVILGGSANSKLFQNVREKASLAYTASSSYLRVKNNIFIKCGIEIKNYQKALNIIKEQLEQIKNGDFKDEDIENAKKLVISTITSIPDTQDSEITYYFGQELSNDFISIDEYIENIKKVDKKQIVEIANNIKINTIYFLKD